MARQEVVPSMRYPKYLEFHNDQVLSRYALDSFAFCRKELDKELYNMDCALFTGCGLDSLEEVDFLLIEERIVSLSNLLSLCNVLFEVISDRDFPSFAEGGPDLLLVVVTLFVVEIVSIEGIVFLFIEKKERKDVVSIYIKKYNKRRAINEM